MLDHTMSIIQAVRQDRKDPEQIDKRGCKHRIITLILESVVWTRVMRAIVIEAFRSPR